MMGGWCVLYLCCVSLRAGDGPRPSHQHQITELDLEKRNVISGIIEIQLHCCPPPAPPTQGTWEL